MDKIKSLRSDDNVIYIKLESIEWFLRYLDFMSPALIELGIKTLQEQLLSTPDATSTFTNKTHNQEVIPTTLFNLKRNQGRLNSGDVSHEVYDTVNYYNVSILAICLVNSLNVNIGVAINLMSEISRLMMEQPIPLENKKFDPLSSFYPVLESIYRLT